MWPPNAACDAAEVAHVGNEAAKNRNNLGVGIIDKRTGQIRLFPFDDTAAFSMANPHLQVQAGHEAAAVMSGIPQDQARGFVLTKLGNDWHVFNQSHLNAADGQSNTMQMDGHTYNAIVTALQSAGVPGPIVH